MEQRNNLVLQGTCLLYTSVMRRTSPGASSNLRPRKYSAAYTACATSISSPPTATGLSLIHISRAAN